MARENLNRLYHQRLTHPLSKEGIAEPLYDHLTYDSAATTELLFFQTPLSSTKTKWDTNMELNGQLAAGNKFSVGGLEIHVYPGSSASAYARQDIAKSATALAATNFANDVWALLSAGWLELKVGQKDYLTAPLLMFPPSSGLQVSGAVAVENTGTTVLNTLSFDYARLHGRPFVFAPRVPIEPLTPFAVKLKWPSAVTLPSGFDARIGVVMTGIRFRN